MLPDTHNTHTNPIESALAVADNLTARYGIGALSTHLSAAHVAAEQDEIPVAVFGRFKAGKSSFLNHLAGREILPTDVLPVTAVITELRYGALPFATVHHLDGQTTDIPLHLLAAYAAEDQNPANRQQVARITVELPELHRFRGLKFVDTPGLESVLAHNTETSIEWLPNAGLALLAVCVDPPLSSRDIDLLRTLQRHTSEISVLLTKADLLSAPQLDRVLQFVKAQLAKHLTPTPTIFPYSIKPGFEHLRTELESALLRTTVARLPQSRQAIAVHKLDSLLGECFDFLSLSLRAAELLESERAAFAQQMSAEKETLAQSLASIHLTVAHAGAQARTIIDDRLERHQDDLEHALQQSFDSEFPQWTRSLAAMLAGFENWLAAAVTASLIGISDHEKYTLLAPFDQVRRQVFGILQQFRERLSERALRIFGVPLRTTEAEIAVCPPRSPDVRTGRIFDRNWELLSPMLPVWAIRPIVHRHFQSTIPRAVEQNLSRLAAQWEQTIQTALSAVEKEAQRWLAELIGTVEHLIAAGSRQPVGPIRADLRRIEQVRQSLAGLL